jgi:trehalose 6-phosphate synthase/phosphatase
MSDGRILIVSNRLPVSVRAAADRVSLTAASGGLATGLRAHHEGSGGLWIGWPGDVSRLTSAQRAEVDTRLRARGIVPVPLSREQVDRYYHGFSNRVLWPLFHYLLDRIPVDAAGWDAYRQVNAAFADVVVREHRPGDTIWVHDYQLMLLPALLRERLPGARIGIFLHIPFPAPEVFRILPWRREILMGLLGADLVGFHTFAYTRHFLESLLLVDGVEVDIDRVRVGGREVRLGAFPMGIDAAQFAATAAHPDTLARVETIRRDAGGRQIVLGIDRLDYTKGIPRRLQAIERLLVDHPEMRDRVRYIQVAVPSRGEVDSYQRFKREVEESVGRINGACGTLSSVPVHYIHASVSHRELVALYRAADVMLVTPLRDGMNLVSKEFVASRVDDRGVLVLSELAGAAAELDGVLLVNPYDVDAVARTVRDALTMPAGEQRARMRRLRRRVMSRDIHAWAQSFLDGMPASAAHARSAGAHAEPALATVIDAARRSRQLRLLLDYDGTLVPLVRAPELAAPDDELKALLADLAASPRIRLEIVSGRPRGTLDEWLGDLPVPLWAEHGFWYRSSPGASWEAASTIPHGWMARIEPILQQFAESTPGSHIEKKSASIAWHYRRAQREFGMRQAHELRMLLAQALSNQPFEVLEGKKIIEVRLRGVSKALVARRVPAEPVRGTSLVAIGDDRTDEDLFRALPASTITIAVGHHPAGARFRLPDHRAVRVLLRSLASEAGSDHLHDQARDRGVDHPSRTPRVALLPDVPQVRHAQHGAPQRDDAQDRGPERQRVPEPVLQAVVPRRPVHDAQVARVDEQRPARERVHRNRQPHQRSAAVRDGRDDHLHETRAKKKLARRR